MKIIIPITLIMLIMTANAFLILNAMSVFHPKIAEASEYSPLDFIDGYDDFSVNVGFNKSNGRYISYSYQFSE